MIRMSAIVLVGLLAPAGLRRRSAAVRHYRPMVASATSGEDPADVLRQFACCLGCSVGGHEGSPERDDVRAQRIVRSRSLGMDSEPDLVPAVVVAVNEKTCLTLVLPLFPVKDLRRRLSVALRQALRRRNVRDGRIAVECEDLTSASFVRLRNVRLTASGRTRWRRRRRSAARFAPSAFPRNSRIVP